MIVKTKFKCKGTSKVSDSLLFSTWVEQFIEGKWYDGEYETWSNERGYKLNNGWRRYWVINEQGQKKEISKAMMNIIFYINADDIRDQKINDIIN